MSFWGQNTATAEKDGVAAPRSRAEAVDNLELKVRLHQRLLDILNLAALDTTPRETLRAEIRTAVAAILAEERRLLSPVQTDQLVDDILDELLGLGPIEPLLKDPTINDILINTHDQVYVERAGKLELTDVRFQDTRHLVRIINKIVAAVGRRVDESQPMVDARLADGSRINAIIPPLAVDGPLVSIRKFAKVPIHMNRLVELGSVTREMADLLQGVVKARRNVLISGGTGSGKTTLLNALSAYIDDAERIITIEDSAELQLQQPHVGRLETRPANIEGRGEITQRELVKNALRMRPDRIIVGEVRGPEAFDLLQAMNTGHDGSMGTLHANSPREALSRLESMITMGGYSLPSRTIREMIVSSIDVIVQAARLRDGSRRITHISEVLGMEGEVIVTQDVFLYDILGEDQNGSLIGRHRSTGITKPQFTERARYFNEEANLVEALEKSNVEQQNILKG
jgi:pilus assembly protein CpaF